MVGLLVTAGIGAALIVIGFFCSLLRSFRNREEAWQRDRESFPEFAPLAPRDLLARRPLPAVHVRARHRAAASS